MSNVVDSGEAPTEPVGSDENGVWTPLAWHYSPDQLIEQARSDNMAGFSGACANAGKHSNPPAYKPDHSLPI